MPESTQTAGPRKAVFLSYAREDTAAANRIAEALLSYGVEVWFDQSELRGGDAWDQKIRKQIDACTLFVPIISRHTEERGKGYFRLEWKLAVEQTHLLMEGVPFLLPIVVDDTADSAAGVPAEFRRVQWTRMPGALPSQQFVEHVKRLLEGPKAVPTENGHGESTRTTQAVKAAAGTGAKTGWLVGGLVVAAIAILWLSLRPAPRPAVTDEKPAPAVAPAVSDKSIAVLPFENMSEEKDSQFFADGIHEDILTNLALVHDLHVVSRTSVMQYRTTTKTIREIGSELHVAYVLEGSVRRAGNKVRVTGQLINARTDEHVWAKAYDRDITDIFGIQAELSQEIAGALAAALSPEEKTLLLRRPTENLAAYDLFLKGRDVLNRMPSGNRVQLMAAEEFLRKAVEADPNFATAWGSLAEVHSLLVFWELDHTPSRLSMADAAIGNALRLAPEAPDVIRALGTYAYYAYRDYPRATAQYEKLARLQPNDPTVFSSLGLILRRQGQWAESLAQLHKAIELDPGNVGYHRNLLQSFRLGHNWAAAVDEEGRLIAMQPEEHLREEISLSWIYFYGYGSTKEGDELFAQLTPEQASSARVINWRRNIAAAKGDFAEFKRLDALQPFFDEDATEHFFQALSAAQTYAAHGDQAAMRERLADFPKEIRTRLEREPSNWHFYCSLAQAEALLGNKEEAERLVSHAVELLPETRDTIDGPNASFYQAEVNAWIGDKDQALAELARLMRIPGLTGVELVRHDPMLTPLHGDARFEALLSDPKNQQLLF